MREGLNRIGPKWIIVAILLLSFAVGLVLSMMTWSYAGCWGPAQGGVLNGPGPPPPPPQTAVCTAPGIPWLMLIVVMAVLWLAFMVAAAAAKRLGGTFGLWVGVGIAFCIVVIVRIFGGGPGGYGCSPSSPCEPLLDRNPFIQLATAGVACTLISAAVVRAMTRHNSGVSRRVLAVYASIFASFVGFILVSVVVLSILQPHYGPPAVKICPNSC
jgi:amino acid transporter